MGEASKIAWTRSTFNPWVGCTRVSPGCENCYAENLMDHRYGRVKWGPGKPRSRTKTPWNDVRKWQKKAEETGEFWPVFCASLSDWLDDEVPVEWLGDLLEVIDSTPNLTWLMLTKRIEDWENRIRQAIESGCESADAQDLAVSWIEGDPPANVWMGVTAENQKYWDLRVPRLQKIPAAVRWVSYEPSLESICIEDGMGMDWVIIGGESAQEKPARWFCIEWAEDMVNQCRRFGVTPFVKQVGSNAYYQGHPFPVKDKAGANPDEWPESIRVREFPKPKAVVK